MAVDKIGEIRLLLNKMDGLINNFEGSKLEMDKNTRMVIDRGSRHNPPQDDKPNLDNTEQE